jgi:hypothetical protein
MASISSVLAHLPPAEGPDPIEVSCEAAHLLETLIFPHPAFRIFSVPQLVFVVETYRLHVAREVEGGRVVPVKPSLVYRRGLAIVVSFQDGPSLLIGVPTHRCRPALIGGGA